MWQRRHLVVDWQHHRTKYLVLDPPQTLVQSSALSPLKLLLQPTRPSLLQPRLRACSNVQAVAPHVHLTNPPSSSFTLEPWVNI